MPLLLLASNNCAAGHDASTLEHKITIPANYFVNLKTDDKTNPNQKRGGGRRNLQRMYASMCKALCMAQSLIGKPEVVEG